MASWYERTIVPRMIRVACGSEMMHHYRAAVVPLARGRVLELGLGAGANLPFYNPETVSLVAGVEPSAELRAMAAAAPRPDDLAVELVDATGEALPFADASFDTVICTFTLCSVADPQAVLAEARRVLKPGGHYLFAEHGRAPDAGVALWQRRLEPIWKPLCGGCHLTRPVRATIERPFAIEQWHGRYQPGSPRILGWMEWGSAVR